jgi:hypothetical protein
MRLNTFPLWVRLGLSIGLQSEGRGWGEWEFIDGYFFMLPVDLLDVATCGEPGLYTDGMAACYGVLPDRA